MLEFSCKAGRPVVVTVTTKYWFPFLSSLTLTTLTSFTSTHSSPARRVGSRNGRSDPQGGRRRPRRRRGAFPRQGNTVRRRRQHHRAVCQGRFAYRLGIHDQGRRGEHVD